jgi:menaquinone-dependent protoporphyrinogen oxidase
MRVTEQSLEEEAMFRLLVVFHSAEGQSRRVADRVAAVLRPKGIAVTLTNAECAPSPHTFDAVIVGDSIHDRRHSGELASWLSAHRDLLAEMPTALFQVSLASAYPKHPTWGHVFVERLHSDTGFDPQVVGEFGGRLAYMSYGWRTRNSLQSMAVPGDEVGADHTDWDAVEQFALDFFTLVMARQGSAVAPRPRLASW